MSSSLPLCPCVCRQTRNKGESTQIISSTWEGQHSTQ
jgi:hypothetical protein